MAIVLSYENEIHHHQALVRGCMDDIVKFHHKQTSGTTDLIKFSDIDLHKMGEFHGDAI